MKKAVLILIACAVVFVATRKIIRYYGQPAVNVAVQGPSLRKLDAIPPQPLVTSLPPLTNLSFRVQRPLNQLTQALVESAPPEPVQIEQPSASPAARRSSSGGNANRQDPLARVALALVGMDAQAEQYWSLAINDPSLSDKEREDLIEDLNEEGFEDPKNPTVDELPLIVNRLQIIEEYAPFSMDDVNARSFAEAYKDLVNMYVRLTGQQPP
jgi:hypothetical protein